MKSTFFIYCPEIFDIDSDDINFEFQGNEDLKQRFEPVTNVIFSFHYPDLPSKRTTPMKRPGIDLAVGLPKMMTLQEEKDDNPLATICGTVSDIHNPFNSNLMIENNLPTAQIHDDITGLIDFYIQSLQNNKKMDDIVVISYHLNLLSLIAPYKNIYNPDQVIFKSGTTKKLDNEVICIILFQSFALFLSLAKTITPENQSFVLKRWNTFTATTNISMAPLSLDLLKGVVSIQNRIRSYINMDKIVSSIRTVTTNNQTEGLRSQIRLVYEWSQMTAIKQMYDFSTSLDNLAIVGIAAIRKQAIEFKKQYEAAVLKLGKDNFPFARVSIPTSLPELALSNYKELYYASIQAAISKGNLNQNGNFKMTEYNTCVDKKIIKRYSRKRLLKDNIISENDKQELSDLGFDPKMIERTVKKMRKRDKSSSSSSSHSSLQPLALHIVLPKNSEQVG
ncbi:TPA_asm: hypothetical protein [Girado virus 1]|nr:TPA_asm: hypothetical protein [Girado virus 1]